MKLLDVQELAQWSNLLSTQHGLAHLDCRMESFSCKMAGEDKRLFKQLSHMESLEQLSPSPATSAYATTPTDVFGAHAASVTPWGQAPAQPIMPMQAHKCSRRTLFYLKATLNAAYQPDYDFTDARAHEFAREPSIEWVQRTIRDNMQTVLGDDYNTMAPAIWASISKAIDLDSCEIYSYVPDVESDPFDAEGCLWGFHYFLYNTKLKRILYFRARAFGGSSPKREEEEDDGFVPDSEEEDYGAMELEY